MRFIDKANEMDVLRIDYHLIFFFLYTLWFGKQSSMRRFI